MTMTFKPMLAGKLTDETEMRFPYLASPKLDGIRCVIRDGVALSRTLKPIPNKYIQSLLGDNDLNGLDGEIICGSPTHKDCFRNTTTVVMAHNKVEDFTFRVFDDFTIPAMNFKYRLDSAREKAVAFDSYEVDFLPHSMIDNRQALDDYEANCLEQGHEGIMLRDIDKHYKFGRSTDKEQILLKVKRFRDAEARVIGFIELEHNENEKSLNELGKLRRSSHKDGKVLAGVLGALVVRDMATGVEFGIGTGLTAEERFDIWSHREDYLGRIVTYKFFPVGVYEKPRHPVFLNWRPMLDVEI